MLLSFWWMEWHHGTVKWAAIIEFDILGVEPKIRGKPPKMDGENNGTPMNKWDDLGGPPNPYFWVDTHIQVTSYNLPDRCSDWWDELWTSKSSKLSSFQHLFPSPSDRRSGDFLWHKQFGCVNLIFSWLFHLFFCCCEIFRAFRTHDATHNMLQEQQIVQVSQQGHLFILTDSPNCVAVCISTYTAYNNGHLKIII